MSLIRRCRILDAIGFERLEHATLGGGLIDWMRSDSGSGEGVLGEDGGDVVLSLMRSMMLVDLAPLRQAGLGDFLDGGDFWRKP